MTAERTDRELLELAGRAAGEVAVIKGVWKEHDPMDGYPCYDCGFGFPGTGRIAWNPLKRDGDALRLAVKLGLVVAIDLGVGMTTTSSSDGSLAWYELHDDQSASAATRRAIVRASAEPQQGDPNASD